jgi:hypothetical protein
LAGGADPEMLKKFQSKNKVMGKMERNPEKERE